MASQGVASDAPLVHAPDSIGYRLLELPAELAQDFKPWTIESGASGLAQLRTADGKIYSLCQKNTSNALILLSATSTADPATGGLSPSISAVATLHGTVELVPKTSTSTTPTVPASSPAQPVRGRWHERFRKSK